jgi:DNA-binding IclR family transcriptional regulator
MSTYPVKSSLRTINILEIFQRDKEPKNLKDIATEFDWPAPSTHAILKTLADIGYLIFESSTKMYFPSPQLAALSEWVMPELDNDSDAAKLVDDLYDKTGMSVTLAVQNDLFVQHVRNLRAPGTPYNPTFRGVQLITDSCAGMATMIQMTDEAIDRICRRINARFPDRDRIVPVTFVKTIDQFRRQGYSIRRGIPHPELSVVAVPLPPTTSGYRVAITLGHRHSVMDRNLQRILKYVADGMRQDDSFQLEIAS